MAWVMLITPCKVFFAHQNPDAFLLVPPIFCMPCTCGLKSISRESHVNSYARMSKTLQRRLLYPTFVIPKERFSVKEVKVDNETKTSLLMFLIFLDTPTILISIHIPILISVQLRRADGHSEPVVSLRVQTCDKRRAHLFCLWLNSNLKWGYKTIGI